MATRGPQNGLLGLERCLAPVLGHSRQLLLNKFFDLITSSMREGCEGEKKNDGGENNGEYQPRRKGGTRSRPARPHRWPNPKWPKRS